MGLRKGEGKGRGGRRMPPRRPRVYGQDLDVPMETYPSARDSSRLLISPSAPPLGCFHPAPLCRAER